MEERAIKEEKAKVNYAAMTTWNAEHSVKPVEEWH